LRVINKLWFHVDGAYGGPAAMEDSRRALFSGLELADSMSIDAHKWLYCPVDCGCLLFRDEVKARQAFSEASEQTTLRSMKPKATRRLRSGLMASAFPAVFAD